MRVVNRVKCDEHGFTVVEVMLAVSLLAIGLLATASMQTRSVQSNTSSRHLTERATHAQDKLEELMSLTYTKALTDPDLRSGSHWDEEAPEGFYRLWVVTDDTPVSNAKLITVWVLGMQGSITTWMELTGVKPRM